MGREIENQSNLSKHFIITCVATTIGQSLPFGYNVGVVNAPATHIKSWCNETLIRNYELYLDAGQLNVLWGTVISIFLFGGAIGSLIAAWIADTYGRKVPILIGGTLFLLGGLSFLGCRSFHSVSMLIIGRLIVGLASGITMATGPMYLAEIAPLSFRGPSGTMLSIGLCFGIFFGQFCSLGQLLGSEKLWHYALSLPALIVLICLIPYPFFPESPQYLCVIVKDSDKARSELKRLRKNAYEIDEEMTLMENESKQKTEKYTVWSVLRDSKLLLPLVLACALQGGSQLAGITAVFSYSVSIFESAGLTSANAKWATLGAGFLNFLMTCLGPYIMTKFDRRPTLLISCFGSGVFLVILAFVVKFIDYSIWFPITSIIALFGFIIMFEYGLGPLAFFLGSEIFESNSRPAGMAIACLCNWICGISAGMFFPILQMAWGAYVFLPFAGACFCLVALLKVYLPETRNSDPTVIAPLISSGFRSRPLKGILN